MGFPLKSVRFIFAVHTLFIISFFTFSHWINGYFSCFFGYFKPFLGFSRLFYILYYACQITTETVNSYDRESDISTHTPHARRDRAVVKLYRSIDISTHTPHARRDI